MLSNKNLQPSGFFFSPRPGNWTNNQYIHSFYNSLRSKTNVVNKPGKERGRSVELALHVLQTRTLVLNWPEDIIHLRFGFLQTLLFNLCVLVVKARGGKLVWVCHNKQSHRKSMQILSRWNRAFFICMADLIVVHSKDAQAYFSAQREKTLFIPHPRYEKQAFVVNPQNSEPHILIWGTINPYKGLDKFIEAYKAAGATFKVLIKGKGEKEFTRSLQEAATGTNIHIENKPLDDQELAAAFAACSIIVLPYQKTDTFSSGALIHSLNAGKIIIGPETGNFLDLAAADACLTFRDYGTLMQTIQQLISESSLYTQTLAQLREGMQAFYEGNTWDQMIDTLLKSMEPATSAKARTAVPPMIIADKHLTRSS